MSALVVREAVDAGYNPFLPGHPGNLAILSTVLGISQEQAFADWRAGLLSRADDWLICPLCLEAMRPFREPSASPPPAEEPTALKAIGYYALALVAAAFAVLCATAAWMIDGIRDRVLDVDDPIMSLVILAVVVGIPLVLTALPLNIAIDMTRSLSRRRKAS